MPGNGRACHFDIAGWALLTPKLLGLMLLAIPLGIFFGCVPGLGGKLGIVLLIPFVYGMDPLPGAVFLLSMHAIVHTGGIVPSILFGVPTNGPKRRCWPMVIPMVRAGQAGRALGAALAAAGIGGLIGVICLALILPWSSLSSCRSARSNSSGSPSSASL